MYKIMIAALATSALMLNAASAAQNKRSDSPPARDSMSAETSISAPTGDGWENRSMFYQGPTYIGRY